MWRRPPRWRHHRFWRHRLWYRTWWPGRALVRTALWIGISREATTHTYVSVTYYHYNPWYRPILYEGEERYILTTAPVGHQVDALPTGAETVTVDGGTFHYHEGAFYQESGSGYIVVEPPVGAEVSTLPEGAEAHDEEGDVTLYQLDELFLTEDQDDAGRTIYRVEPQPPEEELDAIPDGSPSFVADGETYYYVDFSFYVEFEEDGATGFVNGEPELDAQVDELPSQAEAIEYEGETYYQWDSVFLEEVEDDAGGVLYVVVDAPGGGEVVELEN